ncbi:Mast cell surface glycoprotein Gp49A, partial [Clarias magur]
LASKSPNCSRTFTKRTTTTSTAIISNPSKFMVLTESRHGVSAALDTEHSAVNYK